MQITKEPQQNQFYLNYIQEELVALGFVIKPNIKQSVFSLFGKSLPDLYFYKESGKSVVGAGLLTKYSNKDPDKEENGYGVAGAVTQFKSHSTDMEKHYPQVFSDLVRVGTFIACNAIIRGTVIDKVVVLGLLANHETETAILMKYHVDFTTDESILFIGDEINFVSGFLAVVKWLDGMEQ